MVTLATFFIALSWPLQNAVASRNHGLLPFEGSAGEYAAAVDAFPGRQALLPSCKDRGRAARRGIKRARDGWSGSISKMEQPPALRRAVLIRGGAGMVKAKTPHDFFHCSRRGVNRQAVPAAEALSRYPTFKTPGGLVRLLDYVGTISFAMSGTATAGMRGMNLLGCLMVGTLAATGGGTIRDLLLGQTPVFWLIEVEYVGICIATALATFILWPILSRVAFLSNMGTGMDGWLSQTLDTVGLASFAVAGTQHGIRRGSHPLMTIVICCITCSGGGILRDVLTSSPVLTLSKHAQLYVSTTAVGSAVYLLARQYSQDPLVRISAGFWCVVILRALASFYDLRLPTMV